MKHVRLVLGMLALLSALSGCREEPRPEDVFAGYLDAWRHGQYDRMYELLAPTAQAAIAKETFVDRYRSVYEGIEMRDLTVSALPYDDEGSALDLKAFPYRLRMNTVAGPIAFDGTVRVARSKATDHEWKIDWSPSLLFPAMEDGDKVIVFPLKAERGEMTDRFGRELAANGVVEVIGVVPGELGADGDATIAALAERLGVPTSHISDKLSAAWVEDDLFVPVANMTAERAKLDFSDLKGVTVRTEGARVYPYGEAAAHLVGYIGEANAEEIEKYPEKRLEPGDSVGKAGLERIFDDRLRGRDGAHLAIVGSDGQVKETLARNEPTPGRDIRLTVDAELQHAIYRSMEGDAGTAAALHPRTGDVLALVSSPAYDPNRFAQGLPAELWTQWNEDPNKPLVNRFTSLYAPGSVFKPITAAIGLELGESAVEETKSIEGLQWAKDESWGNYYVKRVRDVPFESLTDALVHSDNIYIAQEALDIGAERFGREAGKFGFGKRLPIPYPFPEASLSNDGITDEILLADSAYGQGEVVMTPLHLALAYTPFLNGGHLIEPTLEMDGDEGTRGTPRGDPVLRPETAEAVNRMLLEVVSRPEGTGHGAYVEGRSIAGKTGTAELKRSKGEQGQENGWFVAYDAERADFLLAVMIEHVQHRGGSAHVVRRAAPVIRGHVDGRF